MLFLQLIHIASSMRNLTPHQVWHHSSVIQSMCNLWPPCIAGCGHIYFHPVVSSFFISSPNLSGRTLDVYHTSKHGVALVRIQNACLKCAARGSLKYTGCKNDAKIHHLGTITQLCLTTSLQLRHVFTVGKKTC